jgi:hypothetical protein
MRRYGIFRTKCRTWARESGYEMEENKARGYCLWQSGGWPSRGSSATIPVSGLAWRGLRTWRR